MAMGHKRGQPGETPANSQKPPPGFIAPGPVGPTALPCPVPEVGSAERRRGHRTAGEAEVTAALPHFFPSGSPGTRPVAPEGCGAEQNPHLTLTTPIQPHPSPGTGMGRKIQSLGKTLHPAAPSPWKSTDAAAPGAAMDWNFLLGKGFSWVCRGQAGPIHPCGIIGMLASLSQGSSTPLHSPLLDGWKRILAALKEPSNLPTLP
ncbi:uncharacterized protein LOC104697394 isoform X3 [Corvus cornix cornix]|uniref:uncharacterized protein LOC104697394 isoform X3 n=1 Tax=Corvus cornix cornix TaxID=932674 RepID=UPI00195186B6|nr:uncharacterized protein LOC104697394 isoform X3 [Corvus cornix cornix]